MFGAVESRIRLFILGATFGVAQMLAPAMAVGQEPLPIVDKDVHMGVASCAGSTCHGAVQPWQGSRVLQIEFFSGQRNDLDA